MSESGVEKFAWFYRLTPVVLPGAHTGYAVTREGVVWAFDGDGTVRKTDLIPASLDPKVVEEVDEDTWRLVMHNTVEVPTTPVWKPAVVVEKPFAAKIDGVLAEIPLPDLPAVESGIRTATVTQAKETLQRLVALLDNPKAVARSLHLIASTAKTYSGFLATLGIPGVRQPRRNGLYQISAAEPLLSSDDADDSGNLVQASVPFGAETMGNQALGQIVALMKPIIGTLLNPNKSSPTSSRGNGWEVESLTRALAEAKRAELDPKIVDGLKSRLEIAIVTGMAADEKVIIEPERSPATDATVVGAALASGLAGGIAAVEAVESAEGG